MMFDFGLGFASGIAIGIALWTVVTLIFMEREIKKWKK